MVAQPGLDLPNLGCGKHAGKGRILAQAPALLILGAEHFTDFLKRPSQNLAPLRIAAQEGWGIRIQPRPASEVLACDRKQLGRGAQARRDAAGQFQARLISSWS